MFFNIQIDLLILRTCYGQFTLTTKKSLHIIFKGKDSEAGLQYDNVAVWPDGRSLSHLHVSWLSGHSRSVVLMLGTWCRRMTVCHRSTYTATYVLRAHHLYWDVDIATSATSISSSIWLLWRHSSAGPHITRYQFVSWSLTSPFSTNMAISISVGEPIKKSINTLINKQINQSVN